MTSPNPETQITAAPTFEVVQPDLFNDWVKPMAGGVGLEIKKDIEFDTWSRAVSGYYGVMKIASFALGDLLVFGEKKFNEEFSQVLDSNRIKLKTVQNVMAICAAVPQEVRRPELSFSHHGEVAGVGDAKKQKELLDEAAEKSLNVAQLRKLRNKRYPSKRSKTPKSEKASSTVITGFAEQHQAALDHFDLGIAFLEANHDKKGLKGAEFLKRLNVFRSYIRKLKLIK